MNVEKYSAKAQEKYADSLMSTATALQITILISFATFWLGYEALALAGKTTKIDSLSLGGFMVFVLGILLFGNYLKRTAIKIYDRL